MLFNSYIFILLFFPVVLLGYYGFNHIKKYTLANIFLILMSLWFYGYYNPKYLFVICISILGNYTLAKALEKSTNKWKKYILLVGIVANAGSIFYFKYYNFFLENINNLLQTSFHLKTIVLPLGISFFTFQQISYLVDAYKGETKDYNFVEYTLFVVFFSTINSRTNCFT